jgi:Tfp pilus assembly protein PilO
MRSLSSGRVRLIAVLAALNVMLAAGGWLLLVAPQRHHAAAAAQQVRQTQSRIAQIGSSAKPTQTSHPKQATFRTGALYQLAQAMPGSEDEPDLLLAIDQLATSSGVHVLALSPGASSSAGPYTVLPISLNLQGGYARLTGFLHRLRTLVSVRHGQVVALGRLFSVKSVSLTPAGAGGGLSATVALNAFIYSGPPSTTTAQSTTDTTTTSSATTTTNGQ